MNFQNKSRGKGLNSSFLKGAMDRIKPKRPHILFLYSDTGGGHRSVAEAITEAIHRYFPDRFSTEMVDFFKEYAPPPFDLAPEIYPPMTRMPKLWGIGYRLSNGQQRTRIFYDLMWPFLRSRFVRFRAEHPYDLLVAVHPVPVIPYSRTLQPGSPPFVTVITDLISTHAFWFDHRSDLVLVPTEIARQSGLTYGLHPKQIRITGLPVAQRFYQPVEERRLIRARLGWPLDLPVVLLIAGGDGLGPIDKVARTISQAHLNIALVIVTGRNQTMKKKLDGEEWSMPTFIYGFVQAMPEFMRGADILLTKAGSVTLSEAFIMGLPMILYSRIPGQEDGNVSYVVNEGAGVWAPEPEQIITALRDWLDYPDYRVKYARNCLRLAKPDASQQVAQVIAEQLGVMKEIKP
jgi:1,2-diacylglycerol 3-beta-galactosyltransferase